MREQLVQYYFGRFNLIAGYRDKRKFLLKGLKADHVLEHGRHRWGFFKVRSLTHEKTDYLYGYLAKFKAVASQEVAVPEKHEFRDEEIENSVVAKAPFYLHVKSGLIIYHPIPREIPAALFRRVFSELFQQAQGKFFVNAEIQAVDERHRLLEAMRKFNRIERVRIYLHPSNPSNAELWRRVDERIKKLGVTNYREEYEARGEAATLQVLGDDEIAAKVVMAEDGYGKAHVTGVLDGEHKTISTQDTPMAARAPCPAAGPKRILGKLKPVLDRIFRRFQHDA